MPVRWREEALQNPLFIQTNRILTAAWERVLLDHSSLDFFSHGHGCVKLYRLINSLCLIFMGVFTALFQHWYPAKVAQGG